MNFCCLIVGSIVEVDGDYSEILFLPALDEQKLKFFLDLYAIYFGFHSVLIFFFIKLISGGCGLSRNFLSRIKRHTVVKMSSKGSLDEEFQGRKRLYLGIDFGTSGARYALIDKQGIVHSEGKRTYGQTNVRVYFENLDCDSI